jgi:hypothetical protein
MKTTNKKLNFVIDYALCYLHAAWDDYIQEDLNMEYGEFIELINKFQGNKKQNKQRKPYKSLERDYDY